MPPSSDDSSHREIPTRSRLLTAAWVGFFLFTYWIYAYRPIAAYPGSEVDDGLYLRHARAIIEWLRGQHPLWLGDYDCFLLSKAPLYSIFQAAAHLLGIPIRIAEYGLLMGLPFYFAVAFRPLVTLRSWSLLGVAALLTWLPHLPSETHLLRNALQTMLTSYLTIAAIGLALRWGAATRIQAAWAAMLGLFFALSYLNREEASWVTVLVAGTFGLTALLAWFHRVFDWRRTTLAMLTFLITSAPPILLVCALNYHSYGAFLTTFRRSDAFTAAFQRLTSLEPAHRKRYVPISRETRLLAYGLSPTFAKLQPYIEGTGSYWVAGIDDHSALNGYQISDKEVFVSHYEFALQYTVWLLGAKTAGDAERVFRAIDEELGAAVKAGHIQAGAHGPAILAAPVAGDFSRMLAAWWRSYYSLVTLHLAGLNWGDRSAGTPAQFEFVAYFVNSSLTPVPNGSLPYTLRLPVVRTINVILRCVYWAALPVALLIAVLCLVRHRALFLRGGIVVAIPLVTLAMFCFAMAVVETLGFPFLAGMGYNVIGFSPLSVLAATCWALTQALFQEWRRAQ